MYGERNERQLWIEDWTDLFITKFNVSRYMNIWIYLPVYLCIHCRSLSLSLCLSLSLSLSLSLQIQTEDLVPPIVINCLSNVIALSKITSFLMVRQHYRRKAAKSIWLLRHKKSVLTVSFKGLPFYVEQLLHASSTEDLF